MLPPEKRERALQLFCRILRRLEERDRRNEKDNRTNTRGEKGEKTSLTMETRATDGLPMSGVPASLDTGAEK
jgi:hypothetical protein